jgi:hypothetical protein
MNGHVSVVERFLQHPRVDPTANQHLNLNWPKSVVFQSTNTILIKHFWKLKVNLFISNYFIVDLSKFRKHIKRKRLGNRKSEETKLINWSIYLSGKILRMLKNYL